MQVDNKRPFISQALIPFLCLFLFLPLYSQTKRKDVNLLLQEANSLKSDSEYRDAEIIYRQALVFDSKSVEAMLGLGKLFYENGKWGEAQYWFKQALSIDPENEDAQIFFAIPKLQAILSKADSLRFIGKYKDAEKELKQALKIDKESIPVLNGLGRIAYEKADWKNVKKWFKKVLKLEPENKEANHFLTTNPKPKALVQFSAGDKLLRKGEYKKAEKAFKKALRIYKGSIQAFRGLGKIAFFKHDWRRIKEWYGKVLEVQPLDSEANYCLGIAYRETGKTKSFLLKKRDFNRSRELFSLVINREPAYRDVFYQRGLVERWDKKFENALKWGHKQVEIKPDLVRAEIGLYKLYRLFLKHRNSIRWSDLHQGMWVDYLHGEVSRLNKDFEKAESIFQKILEQHSVNKTLIYLSLVRLNLQQNSLKRASNYFNLSLDSLKTHFDAEYLFEDSKYIFTDQELSLYRNLGTVEDKEIFFQKFWKKRNPLPAYPINVRAIEHYRRLILAERSFWFDSARSWATNPDKTGYLKFPAAYFENEEFNDKGLIYIRHGPPNQIAITSSQITTTGAIGSNESWRYFKRDDRGKFIFHFLKETYLGTGNNWKLAANLPNVRMVQDRVGWDPKLDRLTLATSQQEISSIQNQIADQSYLTVKNAMSSDSHTWDKGTEEIDMPYYLAYFRGEHNKTRVELYYGLSVRQLLNDEQNMDKLVFKHGAGIYDLDWNNINQFSSDVLIRSTPENIFIHRFHLDLEPGTYRAVFYANLPSTKKWGGDNFEIKVPVIDNNAFGISDLELAFNILDAGRESVFKNGKFEVIPNPSKIFNKSDQVHLYFEIYNLKKDKTGETSFTIEYTMTQRKGSFRLFGGGK
ncbi:MAG: tetratricopeptide repeat protein, partial [Bacteroidetes bacterium]|nr:tetratricopeptide repeat protein [Bacteroidota bacterium]